VFRERQAGEYPATFIGVEDREGTDYQTGEPNVRSLWKFQDDKDGSEISAWTGTEPRPRSNCLKIMEGIKGAKLVDGDDANQWRGAKVKVLWGPNMVGNLSIVAVTRVKEEAPANVETPMTALPNQVADDLPF
jgi:hypothetical protein